MTTTARNLRAPRIALGLLAVVLVVVWWLWPRSPAATSPVAAADASASASMLGRGTGRERGEVPLLVRPAKGSIAGTIRTRGGGPIAGARVCATILPMDSRGYEAPAFRPDCTQSAA